MAEDHGKEEEKFDFTREGEAVGYISLAQARLLAIQTAGETPGNYGRQYQGGPMVFQVVTATEEEDSYNITLSFRPQGDFFGTPGQEQFLIEKEGTVAVRQVLSLPRLTGGRRFSFLLVAIGLGVVGVIAAVTAVFTVGGSGDDRPLVAVAAPTETPVSTEAPTPTSEPVAIPPTNIPINTPRPLPLPTFRPTSTPSFTTRPTPNLDAGVRRLLAEGGFPDGFSCAYGYELDLRVEEALDILGYGGMKVTLDVTPPGIEVTICEPTPRPILKPTLTLAPRPTSAPDAISFYDKGEEYLSYGKFQLAIDEFTKSIRINPNHRFAYRDRGYAYNNLGEYQRAIQDYDKAIQLDPDDSDAYNDRGNSYGSLGQHHRAIEDYDKAIELRPDAAWSYHNRGKAYRHLGQDQRAIEDYDKAIQLDPGDAFPYHNRGSAYADLGQYQRAIEDYDKAIQLDPDYAFAYVARGWAYGKLGQHTKQASDEAQACSLDSKYC